MPALNKKISHALALLMVTASLAGPVHAARYLCATKAMIGNTWICEQDPDYCTFDFIADEKTRTLVRKQRASKKMIPVVVDKWEGNVLIAHEDRPRMDSRYIEQFFYKIEFDSGKFLMANEYRTNDGRYLTQEDMNTARKLHFNFERSRLFSEPGSCNFTRKE